MNTEAQVVIRTARLVIRSAQLADAAILYRLWRDPRVMRNMGFPKGLDISRQEIEDGIQAQDTQSEFGKYLMAQVQSDGRTAGECPTIGECKMVLPDEAGISRTDVKLCPEFWGHKYGVEIKQALVDYLFSYTDCQAVEGTPNVNNIASIKMQEAVGAVRVGEETYHFPESRADNTTPVHHYIYHVTRGTWERDRQA